LERCTKLASSVGETRLSGASNEVFVTSSAPALAPTIEIELLKPKKAIVVLDGHLQKELQPKRKHITTAKLRYETSLIRFKGDFHHRLKVRPLFPKR